MNILVWAAEHSAWISCAALIIVIPLKLEHWLPKRIKKYLLIIDIFILVSTPLLGILKEKLDNHWKSQLSKQSEIHSGEIATLKRNNKELQNKLDKAEKGIAKLIKVDTSKSDKQVKLPAFGKFTYEKTDNSAHKVIITPSVPGQTIGSGLTSYELTLQDENVTLELSDSKWSITH
jgi:hypothetical protein